MRKIISLMLVMGCLSAAPSAFAGNNVYKVELNKTEIVRLPGPASSIIVGNPNIADISVQSVDTIFVVGRGYGETNLIVLDAQGNTMMDANLQVVNTLSPHGVRLYNAKSRETYSCIPYCGPSPVLGDSADFIGGNTNANARLDSSNVASSGASSAASPSASSGTTAGGAGGDVSQAFGTNQGTSQGFGSDTNF